MTIGMPMLMGAEAPQWLHQVQVLPGARRGHIEETALFLDLLVVSDSHVQGKQPSVTLSTKTAFHSCPFAEWIVDNAR